MNKNEKLAQIVLSQNILRGLDKAEEDILNAHNELTSYNEHYALCSSDYEQLAKEADTLSELSKELEKLSKSKKIASKTLVNQLAEIANKLKATSEELQETSDVAEEISIGDIHTNDFKSLIYDIKERFKDEGMNPNHIEEGYFLPKVCKDALSQYFNSMEIEWHPQPNGVGYWIDELEEIAHIIGCKRKRDSMIKIIKLLK